MSEEKDLKMEGETLAKKAVESGMGRKQLTELYRLSKVKPIEYLDAYAKRQFSRTLEGTLSGRDTFAYVSELISKYDGQKPKLQKILMYAVMLYDYYEKEPLMRIPSIAEPVVRKEVEKSGYTCGKIDPQIQGNEVCINVHVPGFAGNPRDLAVNIKDALMKKQELFGYNLKVWIQR